MTLDEFKEYQKQSLIEFRKRLSSEDRSEAVREVRKRLLNAKIIDASGKLASPYR